jgi:preprotein translocase subunit Sec61beta
MKSKFLTIDTRDFLKSLFIAFLTSFLAGILKVFETGATFNWPTIKPILIAGICAAISYMLKALMSNSRDELFTKEPAV